MTKQLTKENADTFKAVVLGWRGVGAPATITRLRELGWTIEQPEPRYQAQSSGKAWRVVDTQAPGDNKAVAVFYSFTGFPSHPNPEAAAKAEADRLNAKANG